MTWPIAVILTEVIGVREGQLVVEKVTPTAIDLIGHLAWPFAAIIIVFLLRKNILKLSEGALAVKDFVEDKSKLAGFIAQIDSAAQQIGGFEQKMEKLQRTVTDLRKGVQNIEGQEFEILSKSFEDTIAKAPIAVPTMEISVPTTSDAKWEKISEAWEDIKTSLRKRMEKAGVKGTFHGTSNISTIVNELKNAPPGVAIDDTQANLLMTLAKQYSWMFRTTVPKDEFLTAEAFTEFIRGATAVRSTLS